MAAPMESFEDSIGYSNPDEALRKLAEDQEEDENGLTGPQRAKIIKQAIKNCKTAESYWCDIYAEMEIDWEYYDGADDKQWSEEAKRKRKNRPMITLNHLPKFVAKTVAETKKTPPAIKLNARENGDKLKADLGMGIIRYIEDVSGAKYAYTNSIHCAAIGGFGWTKVTYNKKGQILIKMVKNAFDWMMDPDATEANGSDALYFVKHKRTKTGRKLVDHYEYWWREESEDENPDKTFWAIIEANEIVDYGEFPSHIIPVFPTVGIDLQYKETRTVKGVIRDMRPAQEVYNYVKSQEVELIAMTPRPFVAVEEGQIPEDLEDGWRKAGVNIVEFNMKNTDNKVCASAPNLTNVNAPAIGWTPQIVSGAMSDMREISGIYDTALGADSKEISGKAILAKQAATDSSQYTFTENLNSTLAQIGKCIVSMILPVMGEQRVIRVLGEDGKQAVVELGVPTVDPVTGQPITLDLDFSDMDISIATAPAYATRREAGAQAIQDIMTAVPEYAGILGDIALRNLDVPGAEEAARRVKMMLPAQLQEQDPNAQQSPEALAQVAAQTAQQMADLQAQLQAAQQQNMSLTMELQSQNQLQMQKAILESNTKITIERMKQEGSTAQQQAELYQEQQLANQKLMAEMSQNKSNNETQLATAIVSKPEPVAAPAPAAFDPTAVRVDRPLPGTASTLNYGF